MKLMYARNLMNSFLNQFQINYEIFFDQFENTMKGN